MLFTFGHGFQFLVSKIGYAMESEIYMLFIAKYAKVVLRWGKKTIREILLHLACFTRSMDMGNSFLHDLLHALS